MKSINGKLLTFVFMLGVLLTFSVPVVRAADDGIEARLQKLEDTEAIRQLFDRYIELNESRNYAEYSKLFARDGELVLRRGSATGPAAIEEMLVKNFGGSNARGPLAGSSHILSNIKINVTGNTASATSRWTLLVPTEENRARLGGTGHYGDKLVKENGVWKFKQRIVYRDIPADKEGQR